MVRTLAGVASVKRERATIGPRSRPGNRASVELVVDELLLRPRDAGLPRIACFGELAHPSGRRLLAAPHGGAAGELALLVERLPLLHPAVVRVAVEAHPFVQRLDLVRDAPAALLLVAVAVLDVGAEVDRAQHAHAQRGVDGLPALGARHPLLHRVVRGERLRARDVEQHAAADPAAVDPQAVTAEERVGAAARPGAGPHADAARVRILPALALVVDVLEPELAPIAVQERGGDARHLLGAEAVVEAFDDQPSSDLSERP